MADVIKVIITDDHVMMREGIRKLLEYDGSMEVVAEANSGEECLSLLNKSKADILLLDINMPGLNGIDTLKKVKGLYPALKVLILTVHNEPEYLVEATECGADGYIMKDADSAELRAAIRHIIKGDVYIQPTLIPFLNSKLVHKDIEKDKIDNLTKRELQILASIAEGKSNKDIGLEHHISERTVKNHIFNIFKKIGVSDRTQAAVFAIKNNIVTL